MRQRVKRTYAASKNIPTTKETFRPYIISILTIVFLTYFTVGIQNITEIQQNLKTDPNKILEQSGRTCMALGKAIDTNGVLHCRLVQKTAPQHMKLSYAAFFEQDAQSSKN